MFKDGCENFVKESSAKTLHNMLRTSLTWKNLESSRGKKEARDKVSAVEFFKHW